MFIVTYSEAVLMLPGSHFGHFLKEKLFQIRFPSTGLTAGYEQSLGAPVDACERLFIEPAMTGQPPYGGSLCDTD